MNIRTLLFSICTFAAQLVLSPLAVGAEPPSPKVSVKDVSKKADDADKASQAL